MKTYLILFIIIAIMHLITLVNVTLFEGRWDGIVLLISNILFIIACYHLGIEHHKHKKRTQ